MPSPATKSNSRTKPIALGAAGLAALIAGTVALFEGYIPRTYMDIAQVPTACYGATGPEITAGRHFTGAECWAMLNEDLQQIWRETAPCIKEPISLNEAMAVLSWSFNVGPGAACNSTLVRRINAGEPSAIWCNELKRWRFVKGREVRGLVVRREKEYALCVTP